MDEYIAGASYQQWVDGFRLFKGSILPYVCTKDYPIYPTSKLHIDNIGKIPSVCRHVKEITDSKGKVLIPEGKYVHGITGWVTKESTEGEVKRWANESSHGFGIVCRDVFAIDIDIDDDLYAKAVARVCSHFLSDIDPIHYIVRSREGVGRKVLLYRLAPEDVTGESFKKIVVQTQDGMIEFLFHRCFVALQGTHISSGGRYTLDGGIPESIEQIPVLTKANINTLIATLTEQFGVEGSPVEELEKDDIVARQHKFKSEGDPVADYIKKTRFYKSTSSDGSLNIRCPWEDEHSTGDSEDTVKYYPPNGEHGRRGFKCLHASHTNTKTYNDFVDAIGYSASLMPIEPLNAVVTKPDSYTVGAELRKTKNIALFDEVSSVTGSYDCLKSGEVKPTRYNCELLFNTPNRAYFTPRYDTFTQELYLFMDRQKIKVDEDVLGKLLRLCVRNRFSSSLKIQTVSEAITAVGRLEGNIFDSAKDLISSLEWDGVHRVKNFLARVFHLASNPYLESLGFYIMTALAGRQLSPGCKVDMIPVLVGGEGVRKSSFIKALSILGVDGFTELNLGHKDSDLSRMCDGKVVVEVADLQGMSKRDSGELLAWVTTQIDNYIPKYKELKIEKPRRVLVMATSNNKLILNENTGRRRFLPIDLFHLTRGSLCIDVDYVLENVSQLWAEGASLFRQNGVMYQDAEAEALHQYDKFAVVDPMTSAIKTALHDEATGTLKQQVSFKELALQVTDCRLSQLKYYQSAAIQKILHKLNYIRDEINEDIYFR